MHPSEYAVELCQQATVYLQQAEVTQEGHWMIEALQCYQQALEVDPDYLEPYLALGYLWMLHGEPALARPFLERALHLAPFDEQVHQLLETLQQNAKENT